jgi:putative oxidoreductase
MNPFVQIRKLYGWAVHGVSNLQSTLLLFVRVYWGVQMAQTGWGKLHNLSHVTEFFTSLGLPFPAFTATFISTIEFVGGLLLIVGLFSRFVGLILAADMLMAYIMADREALFSIFSDTSKFYAAAPYTFLCAALLIMIFGPGRASLDTLLLRYFPYPNSVAAKDSKP